MSSTTVADAVLDDLRQLDTPTVCNALEAVLPERRGHGYTTEPLFCLRPELPPIVAYARTARIRAMHPNPLSGEAARALSLGYYEYIAGEPRPSVAVIQDLDDAKRGYGAWWGEVNSNIHYGLGCLGTVTDGSVRDLDGIAEGFQMLAGRVGPSHAFVHAVDYANPVSVAGMEVRDGDLVHADRHGAVVVPAEAAPEIAAAAQLVTRREAVIIEAARREDFDLERLKAAWAEAAKIR